jgi:Lipase (class 3)
VESCADIHNGLQDFYKGAWVLVNCTTVGQPLKPAHFLAVKRQAKEQEPTAWTPSGGGGGGGDADGYWPPLLLKAGGTTKASTKKRRKELEVVLVIRGTKELGDALSDALLEPATYRGGRAHDGILQSAKWIHDSYREWIMHLRHVSQSTHVRLWLVGHSLGYVAAHDVSVLLQH